MTRQQGAMRAGVVQGLLALAVAGCGQRPVPVEQEPVAVEDESATVKAVEALGGRVTLDASRPGKPVVAVDLRNTRVTDAGLKELKGLHSLQMLNLFDTPVTDAGLKELKGLQSLQEL